MDGMDGLAGSAVHVFLVLGFFLSTPRKRAAGGSDETTTHTPSLSLSSLVA